MQSYMLRLADAQLARALDACGAVLVEGPKWCGKTTTSLQQAGSVLYMQDPLMGRAYREMAALNITSLLQGTTPRLIDEWQMEPSLWDAVRFTVDERGEEGQFILTDSATPPDRSQIAHSGTGRFARLRMRPMSLFESGDSDGAVSLAALLDGEGASAPLGSLSIEDLAFLCCRGGWPQSVHKGERTALAQADYYLQSLATIDIGETDGRRRNPGVVTALLRSYARAISSQRPEHGIYTDLLAQGVQVSKSTFLTYLQALREVFAVDDLRAWNPNLRSKSAIRQTPTRHFGDPSLACATLQAGPGDLVRDLKTFGLVFEDLCVRDLRAIADSLGGDVYHYRDESGLECDAVVHLRDGRFGLVKVKLGGQRAIEAAMASLRKLRDKIDGSTGAPVFCMVLVGVNSGCYTTPDGISVVPIDRLGP